MATKTKQMGLLGPALVYHGPVRIEGTVQRAGPWIPPTCPKCRAEPPAWVQGDVSRYIPCGATWYRTRYTYTPPAKPIPKRPVWLHPVKEVSA